MGNDDVAELLVDLDDLAVDVLVDELVVVADRLDVDLAARQEGLDAEHVDDHTALRAGLDEALHDLVVLEGLVHSIPRLEGAGLAVGKHQLALLVLGGLDIHFHLVADLHVGIVAEFGHGDDALALATDGDNDLALGDGGHLTLDHFVLDDLGQGGAVSVLDGLLVGVAIDITALESIPIKVLRLHGRIHPHTGSLGFFFLLGSLHCGGLSHRNFVLNFFHVVIETN